MRFGNAGNFFFVVKFISFTSLLDFHRMLGLESNAMSIPGPESILQGKNPMCLRSLSFSFDY